MYFSLVLESYVLCCILAEDPPRRRSHNALGYPHVTPVDAGCPCSSLIACITQLEFSSPNSSFPPSSPRVMIVPIVGPSSSLTPGYLRPTSPQQGLHSTPIIWMDAQLMVCSMRYPPANPSSLESRPSPFPCLPVRFGS